MDRGMHKEDHTHPDTIPKVQRVLAGDTHPDTTLNLGVLGAKSACRTHRKWPAMMHHTSHRRVTLGKPHSAVTCVENCFNFAKASTISRLLNMHHPKATVVCKDADNLSPAHCVPPVHAACNTCPCADNLSQPRLRTTFPPLCQGVTNNGLQQMPHAKL